MSNMVGSGSVALGGQDPPKSIFVGNVRAARCKVLQGVSCVQDACVIINDHNLFVTADSII